MNFFEQKNRSYKDWFEFNRREQRGILVLLTLIIILLVIRLCQNVIPANQCLLQLEHYELMRWASVGDSFESESYRAGRNFDSGLKSYPECFAFDPNTVDSDVWQQLGLSEKQAAVILRYVEKGGRFRRIEDLRKIYALPPGFVDHVASCLQLPENFSETNSDHDERDDFFSEKKYGRNSVAKTSHVININSADTLELRKIPGIGPYFARKIFQYRQKLGGFYDKQQLLEVYRMTAEKLDSISPFILIDPTQIELININEVSAEELSAHPYISKREAAALIAFRDKHGAFRSASDLLNCKALDEKTFERIRNYLDVH